MKTQDSGVKFSLLMAILDVAISVFFSCYSLVV